MSSRGVILRSPLSASPKAVHEVKRALLKGHRECAFVITAERSKLFADGPVTRWALVISPEQYPEEGEITAEEAARIIRDFDMDRYPAGDSGRIYELPGRPFYETYRGYFETKRYSALQAELSTNTDAPQDMASMDHWAECIGDKLTLHVSASVREYLIKLRKHPGSLEGRAFARYVGIRILDIEIL